MEFNIDIRRKQLESLDQFISSSKDRVDSILEHFGWNAEKVVKNQKETVKCPLNSGHRLPIESANIHIENCIWRKESYNKNDIPLSEPNYIPGSTILLDDMAKVNILNSALAANPHMRVGWRSTEPAAKTSNRLLATFTPDERLALYDFSVTATKGPPQVPEFNVEPKIEEKHNLTPYELKALERDAKRRRMKYKSKAIHTNNKSNTEITRELIDGQMELYEEWLVQKNAPLPPMPHTPPEEKSVLVPVILEEKIEETSMGAQSPRSSQNSIKSQGDHRNRFRRRSRSRSNSRSRTRERSRSRSRKTDYRNSDYRYNRRFEDRSYDRNRKYDSRRRDSRERRNNRSFSRTRSEY